MPGWPGVAAPVVGPSGTWAPRSSSSLAAGAAGASGSALSPWARPASGSGAAAPAASPVLPTAPAGSGPGPISGAPTASTSARRPSLFLASLAGLVVGLVIAALWVAAALETRHLLAELAVVVGLASGLILRGAARRGGVGPAISAFVIALVAVAFGLSLAALAVYTTSNGSSLQSALEHLDGALLSNIWKDIGETGAILGGAGVIIAALIALIQRPASRS